MTEENIFLFVPNIIGYARIILALISFYFMPTNHIAACWCYVISALLDAFDGHAARYYNQSTKFGAMLDQLTDRCGTLGLCMTLAYFYPKYMYLFQLSAVIDISCHWLYLHTTQLQGKTSHKFVDMSGNPIMRLYYTNKNVLFTMCAANEAFYASLYMLYFSEGPIGGLVTIAYCQVGGNRTYLFFFFVVAGMSLYRAIAYVTAPLAIIKSLISVLHGIVASKNLSIIDVNERKALSEKAK